MSTIAPTHIEIDENGVAWIDGTRVKVIELVIDKMVHGSSPEEIHFQYPHVSLAQIHAALAYYYDNQEALETEIARRWQNADALVKEISNFPLRQKLLSLKGGGREAGEPKVYRRGNGRDTWHQCNNCGSWPRSDFEESTAIPSTGELCNECSAKQLSGSCHQ